MAKITLKGSPIHTIGNLPAVGATAPNFKLAGADLSDVELSAFAGKKKVLNIVPSLDTGICQMSARRFNQDVGQRAGVVVLTISADLPFASKRFCDSEKLTHVVTLSTFRSPSFGKDYGTVIVDGPLAGLQSRAVIVLDAQNRVLLAQQVPEIAQEPDYAPVLAALDRA